MPLALFPEFSIGSLPDYGIRVGHSPRVTQLDDGRFVVMWLGGSPMSGSTIYARIFAADGTAVSEPFTVAGGDSLYGASVTALANGGFAFVGSVGYGFPAVTHHGVLFRAYDSSGTPASDTFTVSPASIDNDIIEEAVTALPGGGAVVFVREYLGQSYLVEVGADGATIGTTVDLTAQGYSAVDLATLTDGTVVLASYGSGTIVLRLSAPDLVSAPVSAASGGAIEVAITPTDATGAILVGSESQAPSEVHVSTAPDGGFMIAYRYDADTGSTAEADVLRVAVFDNAGVQQATFDIAYPDINGTTANNFGRVTALGNGEFLITWRVATGTNGYDLLVQHFGADGLPLSDPTTLHNNLYGDQSVGQEILTDSGDVMIVFMEPSNVPDSNGLIDRVHAVIVDLPGGDSAPVSGLVLLGDDATDDSLLGGAGDDTISGLGGVDTLEGGAGDDRLLGGTGSGDTAIYAGAIDGYDFAFGPDGLIVTDTDTINGNEGTDTLTGIEDLVFGDGARVSVRSNTSGDRLVVTDADNLSVYDRTFDSADAYSWDTRTWTFTLGQATGLVIAYDNGDRLTQTYTYIEGVRTLVTSTVEDLGDTIPDVASYTNTYAVNGALTSRLITYENGDTTLQHLAPNGSVQEQVRTDVNDDEIWSTFTIAYSAAGDMVSHSVVYDSGDTVVTEFAVSFPGAMERQVMTDGNDDAPWHTKEIIFGFLGGPYLRTVINDDGTSRVTEFDPADGSLVRDTYTEDGEDVLVFVYADDGSVESRQVLLDGGDTLLTEYVDGVMATVTYTDVDGSSAWETRIDHYAADGFTLEQRVFTFDDRADVVIDF